MNARLWIGLLLVVAGLLGLHPNAVIEAAEPTLSDGWSAIANITAQDIAVTRRAAPKINGHMLRVEDGALIVMTRDRGVRVDRADVCDVTTYESLGIRRAKYVGISGVAGVGVGVLRWYAQNLGDVRNTNLAKDMAIGALIGAAIGLAAATVSAPHPLQPEVLYRATDRAGCP